MSAFSLRMVLKAEHKSREHLGVHLRELMRPNLLNHLACGGRKSTAVAHRESGFERDGDSPTGVILTDVRLVDPSASKVKTSRDAIVQ